MGITGYTFRQSLLDEIHVVALIWTQEKWHKFRHRKGVEGGVSDTVWGSKKHFVWRLEAAFRPTIALTKRHLLIHVIEATDLAQQGSLEGSGKRVKLGSTYAATQCNNIWQSCRSDACKRVFADEFVKETVYFTVVEMEHKMVATVITLQSCKFPPHIISWPVFWHLISLQIHGCVV